MKAYCGKCMKECGLQVIVGPMEYEKTEFWGQIENTPMGRDVAVLSSCHMYKAYPDKKCWEEFSEYELSMIGEIYESY